MLRRSALLFAASIAPALADSIVSGGPYAITRVSLDPAGGVSSSLNYSQSAAISGGTVAQATSAGGGFWLRPGFVGQLYEVLSAEIDASPASVQEGVTIPFTGNLVLGDGTTLNAGSPGFWRILSGPLSLTPQGAVVAGPVYQNTTAVVALGAEGFVLERPLTVLNLGKDDFGIYGSDGIEDTWQIQWFGQANPLGLATADASGTGQTNLFKWLAGLDPLDPSARFVVLPGALQGNAATLSFGPCNLGRRYTLLKSADFVQWTALPPVEAVSAGQNLSVTDPSPLAGTTFYKVDVSLIE